MNKKIPLTVLALALSMMLTAVAPVFAKNMHLPDNAFDVVYMDGEGVAVVDLPNPVPENYPPTATKMWIGVHIDVAPAKYEGVRLYIMLWEEFPVGGGVYSWQPWAEVATNPNMADLLRVLWGGCAAEHNLAAAEYYCALLGIDPSYAPYLTTDNVFPVSSEELTVERHGNNILVNLATSQQVKQPMTFGTFYTLPALSMELHKFGGSVHKEGAFVMSGFPGAWGGTLEYEETGFNANGAFTCPAWGYNAVPISEGWITMNGVQTWYSPP